MKFYSIKKGEGEYSMNISSATSTQKYQPPVQDTTDKQIQLLENQKQKLQENIEKIKEGKSDVKTKNERIKELQEQITQIDAQIQQSKAEKVKNKMEPKKNENKEEEQEKRKKEELEEKGVIYTPSMDHLIKASNTYSSCYDLSKVKTQIIGEIRVAQSEANSAKSPSEYQADRLPGLNSKLIAVEERITKKFKEIDKEISKEQKENIKTRNDKKETNPVKEQKNENGKETDEHM